MKKFLKKHLVEMILSLILIAGLCLLLYPTVSDWWNSMHQTRAIASYTEAVENTSEEDLQAMLNAAYAYNERLRSRASSFTLNEEEMAEYESLLDLGGSGVMGVIEIPVIKVNLPIYHGTEEEVLQVAVGHITGSSLPVGGTSTHSLLSGHRGLPSARLFTDLDKIVEGDIFTITVLNHKITYQVDQIRIVLPEEVDQLSIVEGEDYCTLITCTPYGVNTHRILIRGRRIENMEGEFAVHREATRIPSYLVLLAVGLPVLVLIFAGTLIYYQLKRPKKSEKEILEDLKNR
ncbi:class C sortase [bacterium 1XD21-13]|nr:class C sortase [bacterium 1XD21-13]